MKTPNTIAQVAEFHVTFKHPILATPRIPQAARAALRVELLAEELKELQEAINKGDIIEAADALCDLQYVLSGAVLEFGLGDTFKALFDEVHRSNMSKACDTMEEAEATVTHYFEKDGTVAGYRPDGGKYLVFRVADNKTLKSINYSPANLGELLCL